MIVYPAIDILDGRVVRMTRGDFATVEEVAKSPLEAAKRLVADPDTVFFGIGLAHLCQSLAATG